MRYSSTSREDCGFEVCRASRPGFFRQCIRRLNDHLFFKQLTESEMFPSLVLAIISVSLFHPGLSSARSVQISPSLNEYQGE